MGLLDSLYGQGDYADAGMILPYAITPEGERVLSFPAPIQAAARTVGRAMGDLPLDIDPETGLPTEDVLMDAFDLAGAVTGLGLLAPRQAGQKLLYRYDAPEYQSPGEGAVFFSPDKSYVDLYGSDDRVLRQAEMPRDVFDIRSSENSDLVLGWASNKADELEQSGVSRGVSDVREGVKQGGAAGASRALAALNLSYNAVPGRAEKMFMDDLGLNAMTIKEAGRSGDDYSIAFRDAPRDTSSDVTLGMGGREDVSDTLLMQQPKKRPKIRQMPQAEQDLYEAAAAFQLPREVGEGLLLPRRAYEYGARTADVGSQGLLVDPGFQNLSRDMPDLSGTVVRDLNTLARSPDLDIQSLIGRTAKLMPGDMTMAGKEITHVQGVKLKNPVRMRGGKDFSAEDLSRELGLVWASNPSVISGYAKQAREIPGLLGFYTAMGGRGGDFSHHVADVLVDMTSQAKKWIPENKIAEFNDEVKNLKVTREDPDTGEKITTTPFTDFPGITSPKLQKYMYSEGKGAARKAIADTMEKKSYRDSGFPDVAAVRMVVSDPQMSSRVNDPSGQLAPTGGRIVEFDADPMLPMAGQGNTPMFHKTYSQGISGTDLGGLSTPVPRILLAPDFFAGRRAAGKAPSSDRRSAEISNVLTVIRPEIADDVSVFQEYFNRGLLGKGM